MFKNPVNLVFFVRKFDVWHLLLATPDTTGATQSVNYLEGEKYIFFLRECFLSLCIFSLLQLLKIRYF